MGPADLASVIFTVKNKNEQEFTSDRNRLFAAIDAYVPGIDHEVGFNTMRAYDTYRDAAKFLSTIPNRRKAIILISAFAPPVLPLDVPATAIVGQPMPTVGLLDPRIAPDRQVGPIVGWTANDSTVKMEGMKQLVLEDALRGNVTFYNVNPISMPGLDAEVARLFEPAAATDDRPATSFATPTSGPPPTPKYYADVRSTGLDLLTGGFSISRPGQFADGITQIFRETGSYYLLGYTNPEAKDNGKFRKIEVKVNREDLIVRARTGYVAPKKNDAAKYVSAMWNAISGLVPATDIPIRAHVSTFAIPGKDEVAVAIALGLREPVAPESTKSIPEIV
jgi:VWFA-related protein